MSTCTIPASLVGQYNTSVCRTYNNQPFTTTTRLYTRIFNCIVVVRYNIFLLFLSRLFVCLSAGTDDENAEVDKKDAPFLFFFEKKKKNKTQVR